MYVTMYVFRETNNKIRISFMSHYTIVRTDVSILSIFYYLLVFFLHTYVFVIPNKLLKQLHIKIQVVSIFFLYHFVCLELVCVYLTSFFANESKDFNFLCNLNIYIYIYIYIYLHTHIYIYIYIYI